MRSREPLSADATRVNATRCYGRDTRLIRVDVYAEPGTWPHGVELEPPLEAITASMATRPATSSRVAIVAGPTEWVCANIRLINARSGCSIMALLTESCPRSIATALEAGADNAIDGRPSPPLLTAHILALLRRAARDWQSL